MQAANRFQIDSWYAWLPGIEENNHDWQGYFSGVWQASDERADVSFLPAMQRRRLSPLARAVTHVLHHCVEEYDHPMIFCTRYGEVQRTNDILRDIAAEQDLSPTAFGLSVYNAVAGQVSIMQKNTEAMSTLVPQEDDYLVAFADALGQIAQGESEVTLVFYEEPQSEFQAPYCYPLPAITALAVKISPAQQNQKSWQLSYQPSASKLSEPGSGILDLLRFFVLNQASIQLGHWRISE